MLFLNRTWKFSAIFAAFVALAAFNCDAQVDSVHRNLLELGYDQPINSQGPQGLYAYYYYNNPDIHGTNMDLRLAIAPLYLDGELAFKQLLSPSTDVGIGFSGGLYGENYYEVRQGNYLKNESFDGSGGGMALSIYQLLDPGMLVPLNAVVRGGVRYTAYGDANDTAANFKLPENQATLYTRVGLRLAGKEPILNPALGMELSVWYERQWRPENDSYGFAGDRSVSPAVGLYWLYAGLNYSWTNSGQRVSFALTAGGSTDSDRFSAWRLGGVLPLVAEFPLTIPGYYYEELTATRFVHLHAAYDVPLDQAHRFKFQLEAATAHLDYLPGFQQTSDWQTGAGCGLVFAPRKKNFQIVLRYGYGFNAIRGGDEGAHSIGLLFQYDFEARKKAD